MFYIWFKIYCSLAELRIGPLLQVAYKMNRDLHLKFWCSSYHCIKCSTKIVTNRVDDNNKDSDKELDIFCNSIVFTMTGVCHWFFTCSIFQSQNWTEWVRLLELGQLQLSQCQNYRTRSLITVVTLRTVTVRQSDLRRTDAANHPPTNSRCYVIISDTKIIQ